MAAIIQPLTSLGMTQHSTVNGFQLSLGSFMLCPQKASGNTAAGVAAQHSSTGGMMPSVKSWSVPAWIAVNSLKSGNTLQTIGGYMTCTEPFSNGVVTHGKPLVQQAQTFRAVPFGEVRGTTSGRARGPATEPLAFPMFAGIRLDFVSPDTRQSHMI